MNAQSYGSQDEKAYMYIYADQIVVGNRIIPPSKKRPIEVIGQLSDPTNADHFEFACLSSSGASAVRLHRSEKVQVVGHV